ncbi:unnamed protein product [Sphagnum balticum]
MISVLLIKQLRSNFHALESDFSILCGAFDDREEKSAQRYQELGLARHKKFFALEKQVSALLKKVAAWDNGGENEFDIIDEHHIEYSFLKTELGGIRDSLDAPRIEFEGPEFFQYPAESTFQMIGNQPKTGNRSFSQTDVTAPSSNKTYDKNIIDSPQNNTPSSIALQAKSRVERNTAAKANAGVKSSRNIEKKKDIENADAQKAYSKTATLTNTISIRNESQNTLRGKIKSAGSGNHGEEVADIEKLVKKSVAVKAAKVEKTREKKRSGSSAK